MRTFCCILLVLFAACNKQQGDVSTPGSHRVKIIGHGGCGIAGINQPLPFNSMESIFRAVEYYNADGIETDVQLSKDGVLFLFREAALEAESSCAGCIQDYMATEVEACRFRTFNAGTTAYNIGRLEPVLQRFSERRIKPLLFLDLHPELPCIIDSSERNAYYERVAAAIATLVQRYAAQDWVMIQSVHKGWLKKCRDKGLQVMKDFTNREVADAVPEAAASAGISGIAANNKYISAAQVAEARQYGLEVQLHGERAQEGIADALGKQPDFFLTDNIPLVQHMVTAD